MNELVFAKEACERLCVSRSTLYRWINKRKLPLPFRYGTRRWYCWERPSFEMFLVARSNGSMAALAS